MAARQLLLIWTLYIAGYGIDRVLSDSKDYGDLGYTTQGELEICKLPNNRTF